MAINIYMFTVEQITFEEILPIWKNYLWPARISAIEPISIMVYGSYPYVYDSQIYTYNPTFLGIFVNGELIAVNSGHLTSLTEYRSRGLYVRDEFRGRGLSKLLLKSTIEQAFKEDAKIVWSMPREESLHAYESVGFLRTSDFFDTENNCKNCYVALSKNL